MTDTAWVMADGKKIIGSAIPVRMPYCESAAFRERPKVTRQPGSRALSMLWRTFRRIRFSVSGRLQNGKLSEGIVPEGLFLEKNRNRAVFLRGPAVRDGQAGHQKETRKEFAGGSTECSDSGRGEACGKTEKPGKVGSAHAHELFQKLAKRRQCRLILAKIPCRETVVDPGGENAE